MRPNGTRARFAARTPSRAHLSLLGGFALTVRGNVISVSRGGQRVLALLALHDRPLNRTYLASSLWLDTTEERANGNLRTTIWRLPRPGFSLLRGGGGHLALSGAVVVDTDSLLHLARSARERPSTAELEALASLCLAGDILPDWYDEWVVAERERFRQVRLHALEAISFAMATAGRFAEALDAALAAVAVDPLRETAHRAVIAVHVAEGNLADALRQFERYRTTLTEELGLEPSRVMLELIEQAFNIDEPDRWHRQASHRNRRSADSSRSTSWPVAPVSEAGLEANP